MIVPPALRRAAPLPNRPIPILIPPDPLASRLLQVEDMMRRTEGFTLVELLMSTAIMGMVALAGLFTQSIKAQQANEIASMRQQNAEAETELLRYEIGLAGYRGTTSDAITANTFTEATLTIGVDADADDTDEITVQYYEDRFYDGVTTSPTLINATYSSGTDADGDPVLLRKLGTAAAQPAVASISLMKAVMYVDRDGNTTDITTSTIPEELIGISIELTFDDGTLRRFLVGFNNNQDVEQVTLP